MTSWNFQVSTLKQNLIRWFHLLRKLEGQTNCLQITFKSLPDEEWIHRCKEIDNIKVNISFSLMPSVYFVCFY